MIFGILFDLGSLGESTRGQKDIMYIRESITVSRSKSKNIHIERGVVATLRGVYHFPVKWVFSYYVGFSRLTMATAET